MTALIPGISGQFSKTVSETDVYLFAGITGDFDPLHVNEVYSQATIYGRRVAHGALIVGYMSAASWLTTRDVSCTLASLGYDRIRHVRPVFLGDTIHISYAITSVDETKNRACARVHATNDAGNTVGVADHILKIL